MTHHRKELSTVESFGSISRCSCGQYMLQVPGVALHFDRSGFNGLVQLVLEAMDSVDLEESSVEELDRNRFRVIH